MIWQRPITVYEIDIPLYLAGIRLWVEGIMLWRQEIMVCPGDIMLWGPSSRLRHPSPFWFPVVCAGRKQLAAEPERGRDILDCLVRVWEMGKEDLTKRLLLCVSCTLAFPFFPSPESAPICEICGFSSFHSPLSEGYGWWFPKAADRLYFT